MQNLVELELEIFIFHRKWVKFTLLKNYCHMSKNCIIVINHVLGKFP